MLLSFNSILSWAILWPLCPYWSFPHLNPSHPHVSIHTHWESVRWHIWPDCFWENRAKTEDCWQNRETSEVKPISTCFFSLNSISIVFGGRNCLAPEDKSRLLAMTTMPNLFLTCPASLQLDMDIWLTSGLGDKCESRLIKDHRYPDPITKQGPVGLLGAKAFPCPPFLAFRKWTSFSLQGLPWVPRGRFRQFLIREWRGCKDKRGTVKQQQYSFGAGFWFPLRDTHNNIGILDT